MWVRKVENIRCNFKCWLNGPAVALPEQGSRAAGPQNSRDAELQSGGLSVMTLLTPGPLCYSVKTRHAWLLSCLQLQRHRERRKQRERTEREEERTKGDKEKERIAGERDRKREKWGESLL